MIRLFSSSCRPVSLGERCWAAIPEPIMVATRNAVPTSSAGAWWTSRMVDAPPLLLALLRRARRTGGPDARAPRAAAGSR